MSRYKYASIVCSSIKVILIRVKYIVEWCYDTVVRRGSLKQILL